MVVLILLVFTLPYGFLFAINLGDSSIGHVVVVPVGTPVNFSISDNLMISDCSIDQQGLGGVACAGTGTCRAVFPGFTQFYPQCHGGGADWAVTVLVL